MCWVNGLRVDPGAPALSVSDRGFTLADGCFETMRAYGGVIFRLDAHVARLADTAARLEIPVPPHLSETIADAARALRASRADAALRLTLSRGIGGGMTMPPGRPPTTVFLADQLPAFPASLATRGLTARVGQGRRNEFAPTAGLKTLGYTDAVVALAEARRRGADDVVLLDTEGHLSEASTSNVFLVVRGVVHTPPRTCGALPGITRAAVLEILATLDIPVTEAPIPRAALDAADEIFFTSSLREIAPVTVMENRPVGAGAVGPLTREVRESFDRLVGRETAAFLP
jgi:branched-chain amino acid aminotransferase